jgi:pyrroline-5-carboxylate reductase
MSNSYEIAIIGAGNLGIAIAEGIADAGLLSASQITLTRRRTHLLDHMKQKGFRVEADNIKAISSATVIFIAVEPQQVDTLLETIGDTFDAKRQIVVSVATGVSISQLRQRLGADIRILRAMPNTAIAVRESMTCVATDSPEDQDTAFAIGLFESVGSVMSISEETMNAATALGACGIAFFLQAIRAASQGGVEIGFSAADALAITVQTAKGAAELLSKAGSHPAQEIDKVTTPRGCTITGLNELEHEGFGSALIKGIKASENKAAQLYSLSHTSQSK